MAGTPRLVVLLRQASGAALDRPLSKILPLYRTALGIRLFFSSPLLASTAPVDCPRPAGHTSPQHQLLSGLYEHLLTSRLSAHLCLLHAAGPRRHTHFVTDLSLFRSANVTRPPRILQANRVVAHASYLSSFKPFHTHHFHPSKAPSPAAQAATTRTRFNSGLALVHSLFPTP